MNPPNFSPAMDKLQRAVDWLAKWRAPKQSELDAEQKRSQEFDRAYPPPKDPDPT